MEILIGIVKTVLCQDKSLKISFLGVEFLNFQIYFSLSMTVIGDVATFIVLEDFLIIRENLWEGRRIYRLCILAGLLLVPTLAWTLMAKLSGLLWALKLSRLLIRGCTPWMRNWPGVGRADWVWRPKID